MEILGCVLPEDRLYDLEHDVWWQDAADGTARLGLLATLGAFAGPFVAFAFRPVDGPVAAGRSVATVESVRYTGAVRVPVAAEVLGRNEALPARPRLLNDAPYTDGWIVRLRPIEPVPGAPTLELA
ncbi:glycine cleavage system protein H, partial [mine drainage metagenome]